MRRFTALFLAALLSLSTASAAFAATGTVNDSFTVNTAISITNLPASVSYGTMDPGQNAPTTPTVTPTVASNVGWQMFISGSDFTGPQTLDKSVRYAEVKPNGTSTAGVTIQPSLANVWTSFGGTTALTDATADVTGPAGSGYKVDVTLSVTPPAGALPGTYSGSITFTVTGS